MRCPLVTCHAQGKHEKRIERVTVTKKGSKSHEGGKLNPARERIVKRAAQEFKVPQSVMNHMGTGVATCTPPLLYNHTRHIRRG